MARTEEKKTIVLKIDNLLTLQRRANRREKTVNNAVVKYNA